MSRPRLSPFAQQLGFRDPFDDLQLESFFPDLLAQAEAQESMDLLKAIFGSGNAGTEASADNDNKQLDRPVASPTASGSSNWLKSVMNAPSVDAKETLTEFKVVADMPGINAEDISVSISLDANGNKLLTVCGTRHIDTSHVRQASLGSDKPTTVNSRETTTYNRVLQLPADAVAIADRIDAVLHQGVLTITIPKATPGASAAHKQIEDELKLRNAMGFEHLHYVPACAPHCGVTPSALDLARLQIQAKTLGEHQELLHHVCSKCGNQSQTPSALALANMQLQAQSAGAHHERLHHVAVPAENAAAYHRGLMEWQVRNKVQRLSALKNSLSALLPRHVVAGGNNAGTDALARARIQIQVRHPPALHAVPQPNTAPSDAVKAAFVADRAQKGSEAGANKK